MEQVMGIEPTSSAWKADIIADILHLHKCHPETLGTSLTLPIQTHYDGKFCFKEATPLNFPHLLYGQVGNLPYADTIDDFLPFKKRSFLATPMGFEPTTSSVTGWHSNHLNYGAIFDSLSYQPSVFPLCLW